MIRFLLGVIVGIIIFFLFIYFGGGKSVKKIGEGLTDTGKKMEAIEEMIKREKEDVTKAIEKRFFKEEKAPTKRGQ